MKAWAEDVDMALNWLEEYDQIKMELITLWTEVMVHKYKIKSKKANQWNQYREKFDKIIFDAFEASQNDEVLYQTRIQHFWNAYPNHIFPEFVFEDRVKILEHGSKQSQKLEPKVQPMQLESNVAPKPPPTTPWFQGCNCK
jgi:hypothetical protein